MDQNLPATPTPEDAGRLAKIFENAVRELTEAVVELRTMKPSAMRASLAKEKYDEGKRLLEQIEASDLRELGRRIHEAHKYVTSQINRVRKPVELACRYFLDIRSDWEVERRRKVEEDRRQREAEANRLAAEQRAAEVAHLEQIGRKEQAEALAAAPVVPRSVSANDNLGKPEGEIMIEVWVPRLDDRGDIVFSDFGAFLHWVSDRPEFHYLVSAEYGKLKKLLTDNRGMLQPPGLEIDRKFEARSRREPEA
jgi:hypothetical protein